MPLTTRLLTAAGPTDDELLKQFAAERDQGAFELLVWRYAGLVLRVSRAVLRDGQAAEDAAQATFLALARQAGSIQSGTIAGWIFRVARRVSARAARQTRRLPVASDVELDQVPAREERERNADLEFILQEELARLPAKYQAPVLHCLFEGLSYDEAARRLQCPVGTVAGRLARAKGLLAARLARRGLTPAALAACACAIPPSFASSTARAAVAFAGNHGSTIPETILGLARPEVRAMQAIRVIRVSSLFVTCGVLVVGLAIAAEAPQPSEPQRAKSAPLPSSPKPPAPVFGKHFTIAPVTTDLQRRLLQGGARSSTAIVILDGSALFKDPKTLDIEALDLAGIRKGLQPYRADKSGALVHFQVHYASGNDVDSTAQTLLECALEGLARISGFQRGPTISFPSSTFHNGTFSLDTYVAALKETADTDAKEPANGDDRVRAYRVRTPLSKVLTGSAAGIIDVRVPLDPWKDDWMPAEVEKSASAAITALKLKQGSKLNFFFSVPPEHRDQKTGDKLQNLVKRWSEEHGMTWGTFAQ